MTEWNTGKSELLNEDVQGMQSAISVLDHFNSLVLQGASALHAWPLLHNTQNNLVNANSDGDFSLNPEGAAFYMLSQNIVGLHALDVSKFLDIDNDGNADVLVHGYQNNEASVFFFSLISDSSASFKVDLSLVVDSYSDVSGLNWRSTNSDPLDGHANVEFVPITANDIEGDNYGDGIIRIDLEPWSISQIVFSENGDVPTFGDFDSSHISGSSRDEQIVGGFSGDNLYGKKGNDTISGGAGDDTISGGDGIDVISAGVGNDIVYGSKGNDVVELGAGSDIWRDGEVPDNKASDFVKGGLGNDQFHYIGGEDTYHGGAGNDTFYFDIHSSLSVLHNIGNDDASLSRKASLLSLNATPTFDGGSGYDVVWFNKGRIELDFASASFSNVEEFRLSDGDDDFYFHDYDDETLKNGSVINGEGGNDFIFCIAKGSQKLFGGEGDDTLVSGYGQDTLTGGAGSDVFVFYEPESRSKITDFNKSEGDVLRIRLPDSAEILNYNFAPNQRVLNVKYYKADIEQIQTFQVEFEGVNSMEVSDIEFFV